MRKEQHKSYKMGRNPHISQFTMYLRFGVQRLGVMQLQVMWDMLRDQVLLQGFCVRSALQ